MITLHMIVRNESRFVKAALLSALSCRKVTRALVWDTSSTDDTVREILSIGDERIEFDQKGRVDPAGLVQLRQRQLKLTTTPWFLLADGDEIWPEKNLATLSSAMELCLTKRDRATRTDQEIIALVNRTRNVVGDFNHYLPNSEGQYKIGRWSGHINIRAIRNLPGLEVKGVYPNEWYELDGRKIQDQPEKLAFVETWYLHATHLKRSNSWVSEASTTGRLKKHKWLFQLRGKKLLYMEDSELPEVLQQPADQ